MYVCAHINPCKCLTVNVCVLFGYIHLFVVYSEGS